MAVAVAVPQLVRVVPVVVVMAVGVAVGRVAAATILATSFTVATVHVVVAPRPSGRIRVRVAITMGDRRCAIALCASAIMLCRRRGRLAKGAAQWRLVLVGSAGASVVAGGRAVRLWALRAVLGRLLGLTPAFTLSAPVPSLGVRKPLVHQHLAKGSDGRARVVSRPAESTDTQAQTQAHTDTHTAHTRS